MRIAWISLFALTASAFAEDVSPIATDRPGFSDGSNLVAPGHFQIESGFFRTQVGSSTTTSFGDGLLRYGLNKKCELRLIGVSYGFAPGVKQWLDPSVGFKARLLQTAKSEVTFIGQTTVPIGQGPLRANAWNPTAKIAATTALGNDSLGTNLVYSQNASGADRFNQAAMSVFYGHPLNGKTTLTGEVWAVDRISRGGPSAGFGSLAVTYLLDNNRQFDLRIGSGFNQSRDGWFIQGGFSIRF
ncbi:MAG: transporter [Armatimonadetes bacterium]|nr:transporter [Armatimonadota bacterium]